MYCKSLLSNGIRVVSEAIPYVKSVTIGIWIGTGARSEQDYNHGISHFIEHLMFKGTQKRSAKCIAETVDAVGGQLNAFTAKEHTCYYMKVLDTQLELAVDILSDMLLSSNFAEEDIGREREVVLEEVHMYEDTPDELVHDIHLSKIWSGNPLGRNILGSIKSIGQLDENLVREYYQQFYTPDNMVIAAAGNLSHDELVQISERFFSGMTGAKPKIQVAQPSFVPVKTVRTKEIEQVHFCLSTQGVPQHSADTYKLHVLNNVLGGGISSRLFQAIREEKGLAYSIYSYQTNYSDAGLFTIYAGTRPANTSQVVEIILQTLQSIRSDGITQNELQRAKEQLKGGLFLGLESSSSRMSRLGKMETTLGRYVTLEEVVDKIEQVSLEDVRLVAQRLFDPATLGLTALGPISEKDIEIM
ncbi:putative zinc protease [bioreactor metagenome]|uniref:Putative zinc protease n=1 Tax=bioreactor metagenome TaxID=1076179 RepID=A0A644T136_9ZZZZ|nr:pitrilysin family protein [Negativicutes bacterium]